IAILAKTPSGQYAQVLQLHGNLARAQGRFDTAIDRYRQSFEVFRSATGDSVYTWLTALLRVSLLTDLGRLAEAEALADESAPAVAHLSAEDSYNAMYSASVIGALRHAQRREDEAIPLLRDALRLVAATYGEDHAEVAQSRVALAASLIASGDAGSRGEAASLIETAKSALERGGDAGSEPMLGAAYLERGRLRHDSGDHDGARADLVQAMQRLQSPEHAPRLREARKLAQQWGVRA
ncbi:MAG: tetratricopeptide repeat protein, partial [Dokdonella sp.]